MPPFTQGIIIALLISLLIGVIIGFYLRQGRINDLSNALKQQKKRIEEIEQEHERRLQEATLRLQKDYEHQLAEKIELYQTQYDDQVSQLESEYDARLSMMGPALAGASPEALGAAVMGLGASADAVAIEQRIRKQYETRLKEAAQKIQQAYEQHLKLKLNESREALQIDYERRLAEKIAHYQDQFDSQLAQVGTLQSMAMGTTSPYAGLEPMPAGAVTPTTSSGISSAGLEELRQEYELKLAEKIEHYQDDMAKRLEDLEQEYEARLRMVQSAIPETAVEAAPPDAQIAELENRLRWQLEERFQTEYDQRLADAIERYQDEMVQRTQELEQEYEARLQLVQQQMTVNSLPAEPSSGDPMNDSGLSSPAPFAAEPGWALEPSSPTDEGGNFPGDEPAALSQEEMGWSAEDFGETSQVEEALFEESVFGDDIAPGFERSDPVSPEMTEEIPTGFDQGEPSPLPTPEPSQDDSLDLDDLLTLENGENIVVDQPPLDDGGFDLDNLEDLLKEQDTEEESDNLFDNLDDLSNLS